MSKPRCPQWVHNAVFYEIYPQTFFDSNADGIGDLPGIIRKLDYVAGLGVSAIWLNPFYVSPFRDAGYDVADYCRVAPRYGTNADARRLFAEARKRGMRVIVDLVPGHTSVDHPWFKASCGPKPNRYTNRYIWTDNAWDNGGPKWAGKMIHGYCDRNGNYMTNFFWSQPALNFGFARPQAPWQLPTSHPDVKALAAEFRRIMRFWLDMGASGFRVDMAGSLVRNDPDAKAISRFWRSIRAMLDRDYPEAFMVSEWSAPRHALAAGFHADFLHWFSQHNDLFRKEAWRSLNRLGGDGHSYFDRKGKGDAKAFFDVYQWLLRLTRHLGYISVPVGNHDLSRVNVKRTPAELEMITAFQLCLPGVPFIYYGEEIGMRQLGADLPVKEGCYPPRNGGRTPMQWTAGKNKGFSNAAAAKLWLPVDGARDAPNVADQEHDPDSLLNRTRRLVQMRRQEPALAAHAGLTALLVEKKRYPLVFLRTRGRQRILAAFNPAARPMKAEVALAVGPAAEPLAGRGAGLVATAGKKRVRVEMGPVSYGVWRV